MSNKPGLRFDTREIAVVFSLFVFVSLLMFTVGILVGKGLTQAKYDGGAPSAPVVAESGDESGHGGGHAGNSVSLGTPYTSSSPVDGRTQKTPGIEDETRPLSADKRSAVESVEPPLNLIPLKPSQASGTNLMNESAGDAEELLKNPKILSLVEDDGPDDDASPRRPSMSARSSGRGSPYTVQVGSYPNETAARERVEALQKMGFPQAFFSAKELGSASGTWYRVWLGQFPDYETAKRTGDQLQARGEVKNYIVRKNN